MTKPKEKQSALCPWCKRTVRTSTPQGCDGSVALFVYHTVTPKGGAQCEGTRRKAPLHSRNRHP